MAAIWRSLLRDERGFVITAELVLISTVLVLGLVAALSAVKTAVAGELVDVANAVGSLNQSYYTHGFSGCRTSTGVARARTYGSAFLDRADSSDEQIADFDTARNTACISPAVGTAPCAAQGCAAPVISGPGCCAGAVVAAPCGSSPCGKAPCGSSPCGTGFSGISVPPVICPPGPAPFRGTDPFAPGVVSPQNMYLQGISYAGVCAPPPAFVPQSATGSSFHEPMPCPQASPCPPSNPCPPSLTSPEPMWGPELPAAVH